MNVLEIRQGIAEKVSEIPNVRALHSWPTSPSQLGTQTLMVLLPDDPYVEFPEGSGRPSKMVVHLRLVALPLPGMGAERVQDELDELISFGSGETRSVLSKLREDISAGGAACAVWPLDVSVRSFPFGEVEAVGAEFRLRVIARGA